MHETSLVKGVDFVFVFTKDIEKAEQFYGGVLGLPVGKRYGSMPGVEFETGSLTLAVVQADAFGMEFSVSKQAIALHVDDVLAARTLLESSGVEFLVDTIDSGVCHMAFFSDPDGNALLLHNRYASKSAAPGALA